MISSNFFISLSFIQWFSTQLLICISEHSDNNEKICELRQLIELFGSLSVVIYAPQVTSLSSNVDDISQKKVEKKYFNGYSSTSIN